MNLIQRKSINVISIRLESNGDSFVMPDIFHNDNMLDSGVVTVEVVTKRAMLIPHAVLVADGNNYMAIAMHECEKAGIIISDDEYVEIMRGDDADVDALVVIPKIVKEEIVNHYDERGVIFTTPLLRNAASQDGCIMLDTYNGITTLKLYGAEGRLLFADSYDSPTDTMVVYWVTKLQELMKCDDCPLYIYRCSSFVKEELKGYFKRVILCE